LLGTFGTPWIPYRFGFGKWDSLMKHIPSIGVFCSILWISYFFTYKVHYWINNNPFDLPRALSYFQRILDFVPTIIVSFVIGWLAHVGMDWTENVHAKKKNNKSRSDYINEKANNNMDEEFGYDDDDDNIAGTENKGFTKSMITPEGDFENSDFILEETAAVETKQCHREFKMISLHSTAGRPAFDELVETSYAEQYDTTAIYLCGPEQMISSCKKAAGMGCQFAAERIQMALKKNKFVFYEEKFEW